MKTSKRLTPLVCEVCRREGLPFDFAFLRENQFVFELGKWVRFISAKEKKERVQFT